MSVFGILLALFALVLFVVFLFVSSLFVGEDTGIPVPESPKKSTLKAAIFCGGPSVSPPYLHYDGYADCRAAAAVQGGDRACMSACLGYGSCVEACPQGAISLDETGLPQISDACTACGHCMAVCPRDVIRLIPRDADLIVACSSRDAPALRASLCRHPCNGCAVCVSVNSSGGYRVDKQTALARIDYSKRGDRQAGQHACPKSCIRPAWKVP